jgi:hypothetical protein
MNQDNAITTRIAEIIKNGKEISPDKLSTTFATIRNRVRSPIMPQILSAIESGKIVMVYCESVKVPLYLPFVVLQREKNNNAGVVFLNHCECVPGETEYMADARKLKVSLESCYFALRIMDLDAVNNPKLTAPSLIRPANKIYTHMILECINRKYSVKLDQSVNNQVSYMISRYFINTVLGYNPDSSTVENFCLYDLKNPDIGSIRIVNDQFEVGDFTNIATFITKLVSIPELRGRIGKMNVNSFIQMFVTLYNAPMTLALESFPYLIYNILSVNQTTYVNNYHMLKNIVGEDGNKLYGYLVTILAE